MQALIELTEGNYLYRAKWSERFRRWFGTVCEPPVKGVFKHPSAGRTVLGDYATAGECLDACRTMAAAADGEHVTNLKDIDKAREDRERLDKRTKGGRPIARHPDGRPIPKGRPKAKNARGGGARAGPAPDV